MRNFPIFFSLCLAFSIGILDAQNPAGKDGALRFDNEFSAIYDSNIFGNSDEESDIELAYRPSITFTRRSGLIGLDATVGGAFGWFLDNGDQDYQNFLSTFVMDYPNDGSVPYKFSIGGGFTSATILDRFTGGRISVDTANLNGRFRYNVNERWGFSINGRWSDSSYASSAFTDQDTWGAGLDFVYTYSEKLEFFAGYAYSETASAVDSEDHTFRVQAEGEITPKLSGTLGVGYQIRETRFGNSGDPYINMNLAWAVNERLEIAATGGIGFLTTSTGASGSQKNFGLVASLALNATLTASLGVSYTESEYSDFGLDRSDEYFTYQAMLAWQLGEAATLRGSVTFEDADSSTDILTYDRLRAGLTLNVSF